MEVQRRRCGITAPKASFVINLRVTLSLRSHFCRSNMCQKSSSFPQIRVRGGLKVVELPPLLGAFFAKFAKIFAKKKKEKVSLLPIRRAHSRSVFTFTKISFVAKRRCRHTPQDPTPKIQEENPAKKINYQRAVRVNPFPKKFFYSRGCAACRPSFFSQVASV